MKHSKILSTVVVLSLFLSILTPITSTPAQTKPEAKLAADAPRLIKESRANEVPEDVFPPMYFAADASAIVRTFTNNGTSTFTWTSITADDPWVLLSPSSMSIPPGESRDLTVYVDRYEKAVGTYDSMVRLLRESGSEDQFVVTMDVASEWIGGVDFGSLTGPIVTTVILQLPRLAFESSWKITSWPEWTSDYTPSSGLLAPGSGAVDIPIQLTLDPAGLPSGSYLGELWFTTSMGPRESTLEFTYSKVYPVAHSFSAQDNLLEQYPCGWTQGILQYGTPPLVDYDIDFSVTNPEVVEDVYLIISGYATASRSLDSLATDVPGRYKWHLQDEDWPESTKRIFALILDALICLATTSAGTPVCTIGATISPLDLESADVPMEFGTLETLVLVHKDGTQYAFDYGEVLRTIHDKTLRGTWRCDPGELYCYVPRCDMTFAGGLSPVDLMLVDEQGRQTGSTGAGAVVEIPNSVYSGPDAEDEFIVVYSPPTGPYELSVTGTGDGAYDLLIANLRADVLLEGSEYTADVPVWTGSEDLYQIEIPPYLVYLPLVLRNYTSSSGPTNNPPNSPSSPVPADGAGGVAITTDLSWTGSDPDGDSVTYDVYFEANDSTPDMLVCNDATVASCDLAALSYGTHYYWQVVARDEHDATTSGPVWDFATEIMDQHQTALDYGFFFDNEVIRWQEFRPTLSTLTSLDVRVGRNGNPGDVIIEVKNLENETLGQTTISQANVPAPSSWLKSQFTPAISLSPGVKYRIYVYSAQDSPSADDRYFWLGSLESTYDSDCANDVIGSWPTYDYAFITYGMGTTMDVSVSD